MRPRRRSAVPKRHTPKTVLNPLTLTHTGQKPLSVRPDLRPTACWTDPVLRSEGAGHTTHARWGCAPCAMQPGETAGRPPHGEASKRGRVRDTRATGVPPTAPPAARRPYSNESHENEATMVTIAAGTAIETAAADPTRRGARPRRVVAAGGPGLLTAQQRRQRRGPPTGRVWRLQGCHRPGCRSRMRRRNRSSRLLRCRRARGRRSRRRGSTRSPSTRCRSPGMPLPRTCAASACMEGISGALHARLKLQNLAPVPGVVMTCEGLGSG